MGSPLRGVNAKWHSWSAWCARIAPCVAIPVMFYLAVIIAPRASAPRSFHVDAGSIRNVARGEEPVQEGGWPSAKFSTINLGTIDAGGRAEARLFFPRASQRGGKIARARATCECVSVEFWKPDGGPCGSAEATIRLDLAGQPEFVGGLAPEVAFLDDAGLEIFHVVLTANVRPHRFRSDEPAQTSSLGRRL